MRAVGDISVVCAAPDADGNYHGRPLSSCPDYLGQEGRRLFGLATQQETGEVAIVDLTNCEDGGNCPVGVRDLEATQPGINFLPVGAEPVAIASTPGGNATFVASADPGREGLFALPTRCIGPRPEGEPLRDLRTWPACRLPATPGTLNVIVDGERTTACDGQSDEVSDAARQSECYTELGTELGGFGRRKLLISLPSLGELVTVDAQRLLDSPPGRFDPCPIESTTSLRVELPDAPPAQVFPPDLQAELTCRPNVPRHTAPVNVAPYPVDLAFDGRRAFVADAQAPVVHVLDFSDACRPREVEPLLPVSYTEPGASVFTRRVAVSPLTSDGKKFLYAVDDSKEKTAGSVMVFDVSADATERTPLIRPGSARIPGEPPDRIQFAHEVRDVEFVNQDLPLADPDTGIALEGVRCSADPADRGPGALYRPDGSEVGPSPLRLRGVFAALALESGFVTFIDVDDLDAPCRRSSEVNPSAEWDFRGCRDDAWTEPLERSGTATVTDERSCNVVEPHRARAANLFAGGYAPYLRSFPQLRAKDGSSLAVDRSERGRLHPRMLGVNFTASPAGDTEQGDAEVSVGVTHYTNTAGATDRLEIDPDTSQRNSVVLPLAEPRAYSDGALNALTYEGIVRLPADSPYEVVSNTELTAEVAGWVGTKDRYGVFEGGINAAFCGAGVEDSVLSAERVLEKEPSATGDRLQSLALRHADTVEITSELLGSDDDYWDSSQGKTCGEEYQDADNSLRGYKLCQLFFGTPELPDAHRELRLMRALNDRLIVEPRSVRSNFEREAVLDLVDCCFPGGVEFQVRATEQWVLLAGGQFEHKIQADPETLLCERSCDPLDAYRESRVFEIACDGEACADAEGGQPVIGPSNFVAEGGENSDSVPAVCALQQHPIGGVQPGSANGACIHQGLTARFAVYRGLAPSERGMQFSWTTSGGFSPFTVDLYSASQRAVTMPQRLVFVKPINRVLVAEGGSAGVFLLGLRKDDGSPGLSFARAQ
jgi:hypothetical protein